MTSDAAPRRRRRRRRLPWIIGAIVLLALIGAGATYAIQSRNAQPEVVGLPEGWSAVAATTGSIDSTVSATGNVEPERESTLSFETTGTVSEVLVKQGERVRVNEPLARIDTANLELAIESAQADVSKAQADLDDLLAGSSPEDIAEAQARLSQARNQYQQAASSVSDADVAAAQADLESAQAKVNRLTSGVPNNQVAAADQAVQTAQSNLDQARTELAAAKERARLDVEEKANAVRNAQDEFSRIYWDNKELENAFGGDIPQEDVDKLAAAQRSIDDAQAAIESSETAYEEAKQNEINTLKTREADLASATADRDNTLQGPEADEIASARADVQRAQAKLVELTGANRQSDLAAQASSIDIAQAGLEKTLASPNDSTIAAREADVVRSEVAVKEAERNLQRATLVSPFSGTVASVSMDVGEPTANATIDIADLDPLHIDVPVDELDIAQIDRGQSVQITFDALPDSEITGTVTDIAPLATRSDQGTTTYQVTVTLDNSSQAVRPGMTAAVQVVTSEKNDAVLVPRRAVRAEGGQSYVLIPIDDQPVDPQTGDPASERRIVTLGLSNNEVIEITSGLEPGEEVLVQDAVSTFNPGDN